MATAIDDGTAATSSEEDQVPDWLLARQGLCLLINNHVEEAYQVFNKNPESLQLFAGHCIAVFMDALMSFEEDKLNLATTMLKELEKRCAHDSGWLKSVKKVFSQQDVQRNLVTNLETQIILADSQVCMAVLIFLQQELSGFLKGGWVLRKAWKAYQNAYKEILQLYKEIVGEIDVQIPDAVDEPIPSPSSNEVVVSSPSNGNNTSGPVDKATVERLMGAVSFGYGLFQLGVSLLPSSLLKFTHFLGFGGNRQTGVACLMYARNGMDMRAPLATLCLLWYHTIVRPFYALDGSNVQAGVNAALRLIQESEPEYSESSLFLFFKGRCHRLNSDIPTALENFKKSVDNAAQREVKILALHEVAWCHLNQLDFCAADSTFSQLKASSRWSRGFYTYLKGISGGACSSGSNSEDLKEIRSDLLAKTANHQLDGFLIKRAKCCSIDDETLTPLPSIFFRLLVYEVLYIWNALPSCSPENIEVIKEDCETMEQSDGVEPMMGLSLLISGCCYCIQRRYAEGMDKFRKCLELRKELVPNNWDAHISAFTQYELGALLVRAEETKAEGKHLLQNISQYKDYDFEQRLTMRVHAILKNL